MINDIDPDLSGPRRFSRHSQIVDEDQIEEKTENSSYFQLFEKHQGEKFDVEKITKKLFIV